jgi:RNA-directed DNA polymerase
MFERIITLDKIFFAWDEFKHGKRGRKDVMIFERNLEDNIFSLYENLSTKKYHHQPYQTFHIWDPKHRIINKAAVRDRIIHHLIFKYLEKILQPIFFYHSYSCQIGKGSHKSVANLRVALKEISQNYTFPVWSLKMDIKKFFASIDHEILLRLLEKRVYNPDVRWLLTEIINSFSTPGRPGKGVPIGNLTSQIFGNIYLNELDNYAKFDLREKYYFRYADDFIFLHQDKDYLEELREKICRFVENWLKLEVHPQKIVFRKFEQGIDFVGYVLLPHHIALRAKTKKRMFKKIGGKIKDYNKGAVGDFEFNQGLQSYLGMLKHCDGEKIKSFLENQIWLEKINNLHGSF